MAIALKSVNWNPCCTCRAQGKDTLARHPHAGYCNLHTKLASTRDHKRGINKGRTIKKPNPMAMYA